MEQKQLDELEDSYFGEEFIEDLEDLPPAAPSMAQEIKIEPRKEPAKLRLQKAAKKTSSPVAKKSAAKKSEKTAAVKPKEEAELKLAVDKADEVEGVKFSSSAMEAAKATGQKEEVLKEKKAAETHSKKETASVNIKPAKEVPKDTKPVIETSSPVNPWEDEKENSSLFKEASTWKALTGVALVLLVLSLFTQGFNFSEKNAVAGTAMVSLQEAEQKVLDFVNGQLLQPPFQAEVLSSEELDTLYKVTLGVADQSVDSYVTKDGKLFFPQGFDMEGSLLGRSGLEETVPAEIKEEPAETDKPELAPEAEPQETEEPASGEAVKLTLNAKKWIFEPNVLRVKKGSKVVLTVVPTGLDFTFAVPSLGVEKEVSGTTEVEFVADKTGTFDYTCSSCEDWRGMRGNLVVESAK